MAAHGYAGNGPDEWSSGAEPWFRSLVERVPAVLYVDRSDEASSALYVNPQGESLLGYSRGEWLDDPELWAKILHPEDRERVLAAHDRARRSGDPFESEYRLLARDGSVVWVRDEAVPTDNDGGGPSRRAGVLLDITERKLYEEELKESEGRFRQLFENAMEGIARISPEGGTIEQCNPAYARALGLTPEECVGRSFFDFVDGEDEEEAQRQRGLRLDGVGDEYELTVTAADGRTRVLSCGGYPLHGPDGAYEGAVQTVSDVTERRRYEEDLRRSEELFRRTFEAAAVGMAHVAPDGQWLRINGRLCEILDYPREELLGMTFLGMTPPGDRASGAERVRRLLAGEIGPYSVERRYVKKDGSRVWVNLTVSLVRKESSGEPDHFVCVAEDITERKIEELVPDPLTPGEMEVLQRIVAGQRNGEIANQLHRSLGAVKHQVQQVLAKLGVENRNRAAVRAIEMGLVRPL